MEFQYYLDGLNPEQRKAVLHSGGPLLIAAGAGSGKTKTLTTRLTHLLQSGTSPERVIAITFTNKAANEMRSRMTNDLRFTTVVSPFIGTFHSLGAWILKKEATKVGRNSNFTIFDEDDSLNLIKKILLEMNLAKEKFNPVMAAAKISEIKNDVLSLTELETFKDRGRILKTVLEKYEIALQKSNAFDFDDLIVKVVEIFDKYPLVLEQYQNRWDHILVDEFQDVNNTQYQLIKLLAAKHRNLFVIGDDAQSIYAFRGSNFKIFLNFEDDWPEAEIIKLEQNYRSTANIINAASKVIARNKMQKPKTLWTENQEGHLIRLATFSDGDEEAWGIAENIITVIQSGESLKEIAILYRTNAQSRAIEQALIQIRIPYEIFGGLAFYARKEIKDILAGLRYAFNPRDIVSSDRLIKNFPKTKSQQLLENLPRLAEELSLAELIRFFIEETNYSDYLAKHFSNSEERLENIKELVDFAETFQNASEFLERVSLFSSLDGRPTKTRFQKLNEDSVKLMSIHLAKGLEFNQVFLIGANEGLLPHERSLIRYDDLEEERRLMYVAMTRAKNHLHLSFYNLPSRFLGEIPPELIEFQKITSRGRETAEWDDESIYLE